MEIDDLVAYIETRCRAMALFDDVIRQLGLAVLASSVDGQDLVDCAVRTFAARRHIPPPALTVPRFTPFRAVWRFDIAANDGWVSVGIDHDTAAFAVESIRRWWYELGKARYPAPRCLLITADCGGSNGARVRLWKVELQKLANELGIAITVCHLPPHQQVESHRAPAVRLHHPELARQALGQPRGHCPVDLAAPPPRAG